MHVRIAINDKFVLHIYIYIYVHVCIAIYFGPVSAGRPSPRPPTPRGQDISSYIIV